MRASRSDSGLCDSCTHKGVDKDVKRVFLPSTAASNGAEHVSIGLQSSGPSVVLQHFTMVASRVLPGTEIHTSKPIRSLKLRRTRRGVTELPFGTTWLPYTGCCGAQVCHGPRTVDFFFILFSAVRVPVSAAAHVSLAVEEHALLENDDMLTRSNRAAPRKFIALPVQNSC